MPDSSLLVSVIIPAYNQAAWLPFALESVLNQSYRRFEVIVVNDGSTDETGQILRGYGKRIRVIAQANAGLSAARNSGLRAAKGELIGFLDSDDLWYPEMLSATVSYLNEKPDIDLVCGGWDFINEKGFQKSSVFKPSRFQASVDNDFLRTNILGCPFPIIAVIVRRKCFDCCGFFDTSLKAMEDWDLWLRLAAHEHSIGFIDTPVARYRRHGSCMTLDLPRMEQAFQQVLAKAFTNKEIADRCVDLEIHSQIFQRIFLAQYCQEAGADAYLRRCIQIGENLYSQAPYNNELDTQYFRLLSALPHTENFLQILSSSNSNLRPDYLWFTSKVSIKRKEYGVAIKRLFALLARYPKWVIRKYLKEARES